MLPSPVGRRDLFNTGPGPDSGGSKPMDWRPHLPEKSGMDAALCAPLLAGLTAGAACPKAGVAAAVANVTNKRKSRRCTFMLPSLSWFRRQLSYKATPFACALGMGARCLHLALSDEPDPLDRIIFTSAFQGTPDRGR